MKSKTNIIIILISILVFSLIGYGAVGSEKVEAYLAHDMSFRVDGDMWQPIDLDGSLLTPIIYNGRSYVPARALLEEKDVMVGFDNDTRTIILDYPTKEIDKSTPLLMQFLDLDSDGDGISDGDEGTSTIEIKGNKDFALHNIKFTNETTMELSEDAEILFNNRRMDIKALSESDENFNLSLARVKVNHETGLVTSIEMDETDDEAALAARPPIEIEFSGPPWKIKITIKF